MKMAKITKKDADLLVQRHETFYRKDIKINDTQIFIYNYLLSDLDAFDDQIGDTKGTELRGLTITHEGAKEHVFLSCPKFFNVNETPQTQENMLVHKKIKKVLEKVDGSLIQPININGEILMKTKQSFNNFQAKQAQEILEISSDLQFFILDCWDNDFYPLFELRGPDNKIVINYDKTELVLIMVRNAEGEFVDVHKFNYKYTAKNYDLTLDEIITECKSPGVEKEGYVVKFTDGDIVKFKTIKYIQDHKTINQTDSYKNILNLILKEELDDVLGLLSQKRQEELKQISEDVTTYMIHYIKLITDIVSKDEDRKIKADKYKNHEFFSVIMSCYGNPDRVKETFIQHILKKYNKEKKAQSFINFLK